MEIMLVLLGPMALAFLLAAAIPDARIGVAVGLGCALLGVLGAMVPVRPAVGPDDWYRGIGQVGSSLGTVGALTATVAQAIRWRAGLGLRGYLLTLVGCVVAAVALTILLSPYLPF